MKILKVVNCGFKIWDEVLSGAAARTGDLKEKIERTSYENNRITTGTNPTVIV